MHIKRALQTTIESNITPGRVLVIYGARRVGKTTIIEKYLETKNAEDYLKLNGEDLSDVALLDRRSVAHYTRVLQGKNLLIIDEAQKIPEIGLKLKLIVDNLKNISVVATGSSMFDLSNQLGEPLVGRRKTLLLYAIAQLEYSQTEDYKSTLENLEHRLIYGSYPELLHLQNNSEKKDYLYQLVNDYLLKDILAYEGIRHSEKVRKLLLLIALQIGSEVSMLKLSNALDMSKNTVEKYLDLLTKVFVLRRVSGYSKNLRKEVTKSDKWYFLDNGVRNALIKNFNDLEYRTDKGALWENYLIYERIKYLEYKKINRNTFFWRTYDQQEIDWIEESDGMVDAYEIKWKAKKTKVPTAWSKHYTDASYTVIDHYNYMNWITESN